MYGKDGAEAERAKNLPRHCVEGIERNMLGAEGLRAEKYQPVIYI